MNTKRTLSMAALILAACAAACEGEPPKTAASATGGGASVEQANAEHAHAEDGPDAEASAATPAPPPPCACACNCSGAAAAATPGDGGVDALAAVAVADAAVAPAKLTIAGTVTSTPKWAANAAVVYLEDAPIEGSARMNATVNNQMMTFAPLVTIIPAGGQVTFHNSDPFPHNVFSPDGERFNVGTLVQNGASARTFKVPGPYTVLCNLHPGMVGYVLVTPSSYYARVDAKGHYAIKDVPPGTYKVTAWAPRLPVQTVPATVQIENVTLDFDLHR